MLAVYATLVDHIVAIRSYARFIDEAGLEHAHPICGRAHDAPGHTAPPGRRSALRGSGPRGTVPLTGLAILAATASEVFGDRGHGAHTSRGSWDIRLAVGPAGAPADGPARHMIIDATEAPLAWALNRRGFAVISRSPHHQNPQNAKP